jgi:hypothetical protein
MGDKEIYFRVNLCYRAVSVIISFSELTLMFKEKITWKHQTP